MEFDLKTSFDDGVVLVESSFSKLEATNARGMADMDVDGLVKTKLTPLRQELENVHRIVLWVSDRSSL
jgi:hypothetical protein